MKELLLLRHAKSDWNNSHLSDFERPLNQRGRHDAPRMGRLLRQKDLIPDLIVASAAVRAATTAELVALQAGYEGEIRTFESLYLAEPESYLEVLQEVGDPRDRIMAVGHNPGMEEMIELFSGHGEQMPTGAVAYFRLSIQSWADFDSDTAATLVYVWRPRELGKEIGD